jgi:hypothetical protein
LTISDSPSRTAVVFKRFMASIPYVLYVHYVLFDVGFQVLREEKESGQRTTAGVGQFWYCEHWRAGTSGAEGEKVGEGHACELCATSRFRRSS